MGCWEVGHERMRQFREMERDERQSGVAGKELGAPSRIKLGHDVESTDA
jgi:hypothetical protein